MLDHQTAVRYVTPLREGGSMPGVVEADDLGTYAMKFRGAGQGVKVLVAEVLVGELGRRLGIRVPRLVTLELPAELSRYEPDEEVQDLLVASVGTSLGVDLLPGALGYDGSRPPAAEEATRIVWLDALTANVDRTWSNPNLLVWHDEVWAIDHGAALYVHHSWPTKAPDPARFAALPFDVSEHVLREVALDLPGAHAALAVQARDVLEEVLDLVPDAWLETTETMPTVGAVRAAYRELLTARLDGAAAWLPPAEATGPGSLGRGRG